MKKYILIILLFSNLVKANATIRVYEMYYASQQITVKNMANFNYSYDQFQISVENMYYTKSLQLFSGSLVNMAPGATAILNITFPSMSTGASIGIWYPGSLPSNATPANLVDFLQYGSAGHPYESVAAAAGKWTAGDFIISPFPITFTGGIFDYGSSFYTTSAGISELLSKYSIAVYPNPCTASVTVSCDNNFGNHQPVNIEMVDAEGTLFRSNRKLAGSGFSIETESLPKGIYFLRIINNENESSEIKLVKN
jgi:hypothetical protein